MAEKTDEYLRQCLDKNICPMCQKPIVERVGSGQSKDGIFCSLTCFTKWNEALLIQRHRDRVEKSKSNE